MLSGDAAVGAELPEPQHLDPADAGILRAVQHLQGQLVGQEGVRIGPGAAATHHGGFQLAIAPQPRQLTVGIAGIVAHRQQLIAQQGFADLAGIEGAIGHHGAATVRQEAGPPVQRGIMARRRAAAHLPLAFEPGGPDQIAPVRARQEIGRAHV